MRSALDDRTARATIRDEASRLFAAHGPDKVTVRQIATAAGVSPGLVVHHFGSKDGLRAECDRWAVETFENLLGELTREEGGASWAPEATGSLHEALMRHLPPDSPLPAYLRGLLLSDGEAGRLLFRRLYAVSRAALDDLARAGRAEPGPDPAVRAALLLVNDLAALLLRERLADVLGVDPLTREGMARWVPEVLDLYAVGLGATTRAPEEGA